MADKLSRSAEGRIIDALEKAANFMNKGDSPNEAIIKAAGAHKIPSGHIHLMVNAVNTGRTNVQRTSSDDPLEKAAEFPIADTETILSALYPDKIKTASEQYTTSVVSDEYTKPPRWLEQQASFEKAARAVNWKMTDKKPEPLPRDETHLMKKALSDVHRLKRAVEEKRMAAAVVREKAVKLAAELRAYFMGTPKDPFPVAYSKAASYFGDKAEKILEHIASQMPKKITKGYEKKAVYMGGATMRDKPYTLISDIIKTAGDYIAKRDEWQDAAEAFSKEAAQTLRPFDHLSIGRSVLDVPSSPLEKTAWLGDFVRGGLGTLAGANMAKEIAKRIPPTALDSLERKDLEGLIDPRHEQEIRNIQSEAMLNDLMAHDDVIRGYHPDDVLDAYNEVAQMAPHAAGKKAIVRDMMRKRLSGGPQAFDQFTTSDLSKTEGAFKTQHEPSEGGIGALKSFGLLGGGGNEPAK